MAIGEYVDLDLYGRGFDGIFGHGAEQETRRQAMMKFKAMQRFKEKVKPGEYVDLDLYGRGDPRIFGPGAHIQTQKEAQKHLEEAQRRKQDRMFNRHALVFPSGLKAIAKKTNALIRRMSSTRAPEPENAHPSAPVDDIRENEEPFAHDEGLVPVDSSKEKEEIDANDDARAFVNQIREKEERVSSTPDRTVDEPRSPEEAFDVSESVDRTPRRVKSKLPSEEARPYVEKGHVARVIKSLSSFDKNDNQNQTIMKAKKQLSEQPRLAVYSSLPLHGTSSPENSESSSAEKTKKFGSSSEESSEHVQDTGSPEPVSTMNEEDAHGILVESDEDFQLSFSAPPAAVVDGPHAESSTSSEEDLLVRNGQQDRPILIDAAGRSGIGTNKIAGLFRSGDTDSGSDYDDSDDNAAVLGGPSGTAEGTSSTEDGHDTSVSIIEVPEIVIDEPMEEGLEEAVDEITGQDKAEMKMDARGRSIIQVVETPDLTAQELEENVMLNDFYEAPKNMTEAMRASIETADITDGKGQTNDHAAKPVEHEGTPSSSETDSSTGVEYEDNGGSSIDNRVQDVRSRSATDSDRSAEASSSSVATSAEVEDSDDIEIEEADETEETEHEVMETSSAEEDKSGDDASEVRVVDSSNAGFTSEEDDVEAENGDDEEGNTDDDDGNTDNGDDQTDQEDGQGWKFWQRLSLFGAVVSSNWIVF